MLNEYPDSEIFVCTPTHRLSENTPNSKGLLLKDYVEIIRNVAEYYSLPVIDFFAGSRLQPAIKPIMEKYMPDGLHPGDEGHKVLAERVANFILAY